MSKLWGWLRGLFVRPARHRYVVGRVTPWMQGALARRDAAPGTRARDVCPYRQNALATHLWHSGWNTMDWQLRRPGEQKS